MTKQQIEIREKIRIEAMKTRNPWAQLLKRYENGTQNERAAIVSILCPGRKDEE